MISLRPSGSLEMRRLLGMLSVFSQPPDPVASSAWSQLTVWSRLGTLCLLTWDFDCVIEVRHPVFACLRFDYVDIIQDNSGVDLCGDSGKQCLLCLDFRYFHHFRIVFVIFYWFYLTRTGRTFRWFTSSKNCSFPGVKRSGANRKTAPLPQTPMKAPSKARFKNATISSLLKRSMMAVQSYICGSSLSVHEVGGHIDGGYSSWLSIVLYYVPCLVLQLVSWSKRLSSAV